MLDGFDLLADIYRVEPAHYRRRRDELVAMLRLEPLLDQPVRQLSLGQRMRAEFAAALLHDPALLFLDEPTIGLDAPSKLAVREFVRRLNREQGVTVLLTTHDMHDVEALAERVIVIGQGRLLADGPFEALRASVLAERRLYIDFAGPAPEFEIPGVTVRARSIGSPSTVEDLDVSGNPPSAGHLAGYDAGLAGRRSPTPPRPRRQISRRRRHLVRLGSPAGGRGSPNRKSLGQRACRLPAHRPRYRVCAHPGKDRAAGVARRNRSPGGFPHAAPPALRRCPTALLRPCPTRSVRPGRQG